MTPLACCYSYADSVDLQKYRKRMKNFLSSITVIETRRPSCSQDSRRSYGAATYTIASILYAVRCKDNKQEAKYYSNHQSLHTVTPRYPESTTIASSKNRILNPVSPLHVFLIIIALECSLRIVSAADATLLVT